jgi:hypothetical protein
MKGPDSRWISPGKFESPEEYVRADLAGLPEDLVYRLRRVNSGVDGWTLTGLEEDILHWHEQRTGGGE